MFRSNFGKIVSTSLVLLLLACSYATASHERPPELVHQSELLSYPLPWGFELGRYNVPLVSDLELEVLANEPDRQINLGVTDLRQMKSFRQVCEEAKAAGQPTINILWDSFYIPYRKDDFPVVRKYSVESQEMIDLMAKISKFAESYGLGLDIALISPALVGKSFVEKTGESGKWMSYRKGVRETSDGSYCVELWREQVWNVHLGPTTLEPSGVRVFAFNETAMVGTPYFKVDPDSIVEISEGITVEILKDQRREIEHYRAQRIRVSGKGNTELKDCNRVLVVQTYKTPEMDYFSPQALPYLQTLIDRYADAGINVNGLHSDELTIQSDGIYFGGAGEFGIRYVSDGLARRYAELYGEQYRDFAKYLIYFVYAQEPWGETFAGRSGPGMMACFDHPPQAIQETALFRARYYHLLQNTVVDLLADAKHYAEQRFGHKLESRAHPTWAESPTCDRWYTETQPDFSTNYEYTSNFIASITVHQAVAACYDYFKWGDFLTGNGNDYAEGGFLDRNYWGLMMACSTGIINEVPYSYSAGWGMPGDVGWWHMMLQNTFGVFARLYGGPNPYGAVQEYQHRDVDVLMLYPLDMIAVEERFGSWMTQYAYANQISQEKLLELGTVKDGKIELGGRTFTTLVATFEPFPSIKLLEMYRDLAADGGRVIWSGPPPMLTWEGEDATALWSEIFGVDYEHDHNMGKIAVGTQIQFEGIFKDVEPQLILTDFMVDRVYPVQPHEGVQVVARNKKRIVGTYKSLPSGGSAVFLGYRPRDDQSASLGYETRNWFEILETLGAYPATGKFPGVNDNTEYISRTSDILATRFPNGTVGLCKHLARVVENWPGGWSRDPEADAELMAENPLPSNVFALRDFKVNGHNISFDGDLALSFRTNDQNELIAFAGNHCDGITIDGRTTTFSETPVEFIVWAPVSDMRRVENGATLMIMIWGDGTQKISLPGYLFPTDFELVEEGPTPGSRGNVLSYERTDDNIVFTPTPMNYHNTHWFFVVPKPNK